MDNFESYSSQIPSEKGNYILIIHLPEEIEIVIGSLQRQSFPPGNYVYAGSALGPGGIRARLKHHLKPSNKPHWHMDYLKPHVQRLAVGWEVTPERLECVWTHQLSAFEETQFPVPGFGASDCQQKCPAHLCLLDKTPQDVLNMLGIQCFLFIK